MSITAKLSSNSTSTENVWDNVKYPCLGKNKGGGVVYFINNKEGLKLITGDMIKETPPQYPHINIISAGTFDYDFDMNLFTPLTPGEQVILSNS
jgi:hypothetical protein